MMMIFASILALTAAASGEPYVNLESGDWRFVEISEIYASAQATEPFNASAHFLEVGYTRRRVGNAIRFEALEVYKTRYDDRNLGWHEYLADCATGEFRLMSAWARTRRGWAPMIVASIPPGPVPMNTREARFVRVACGLTPPNPEAVTNPVRRGAELLRR